ncbi:hypothetical protein KEM48_006177 [Puccinia striiformis f. sp. tritici PST-130]|uniref:Uncharacterized protein n=1 Tax=Puccinia striiformis f. sp. tritici PST-78 TaxID=1165861 RepID=A0A0L0UT95_9BASI|nr:hypothetical protein Pst134EB_025002 [Puccinia striiformis f. sp. tritici]KAI9619635.1 hypothetical protein KEM48_006177 [Puccinia striiformis f. sp. tritici PST-130]KNE90146.1 hypothetical protein PSTG_16395 [Puccinia striiformis f. sp. tritici PST-78]
MSCNFHLKADIDCPAPVDSDQDGGEKTIINDFREYEADDLPSGNELLNPVSKSNPNKSNSQINKDDGLNTTSRDKSSSNEPTVSPKHQRKSKSSAKLTATELALDDPSIRMMDSIQHPETSPPATSQLFPQNTSANLNLVQS